MVSSRFIISSGVGAILLLAIWLFIPFQTAQDHTVFQGQNQISTTANDLNTPALPYDLPLYPEAVIGSTRSQFASYEVNAPVAEVVQFYQTEMPKIGWQATEATSLDPKQPQLVYTKDETSTLIQLHSTADGGCKVVISINDPGCT